MACTLEGDYNKCVQNFDGENSYVGDNSRTLKTISDKEYNFKIHERVPRLYPVSEAAATATEQLGLDSRFCIMILWRVAQSIKIWNQKPPCNAANKRTSVTQ
jgi:hypothetical protein